MRLFVLAIMSAFDQLRDVQLQNKCDSIVFMSNCEQAEKIFM